MPVAISTIPSGNWYVGSSLAIVQPWSSTVDQQQGYPLAGTEIGGGLHAKDAGGGTFITQHYAPVIAHPTQAKWAYPSDSTIDAAIASQSPPTPGPLDSTWAGGAVVTNLTPNAFVRTMSAIGRFVRGVFK